MKTKTLKQIEKERYRNEIIKNERNRIKKLIDELAKNGRLRSIKELKARITG